MNPNDLRHLLDAVASGDTSPEDAMERLAELPFADLGFAKLDLHRELRSGLPEAIYAEGKRADDLAAICRRVVEGHGRALVTRVDAAKAAAVMAEVSGGTFHERASLLTFGEPHPPQAGDRETPVAVLAAGTSDLPVAAEVAGCLEFFGHTVERLWDVGVAGLHRLLGHLPAVRRAGVVVAVAGMDGALPTVTSSLVQVPVVAVPTSVGYGASFGGVAALLTMLNSCSPGVAVVNIDNGYGAAVLASRILRGAARARAASVSAAPSAGEPDR